MADFFPGAPGELATKIADVALGPHQLLRIEWVKLKGRTAGLRLWRHHRTPEGTLEPRGGTLIAPEHVPALYDAIESAVAYARAAVREEDQHHAFKHRKYGERR